MSSRDLPLAMGTPPTRFEPSPSVEHGEACITCGDVALPLTVVTVEGDDAVCRADDGATEVVAVDLVGPLRPGDRVLVHARVALERLGGSAP